MSADAEDLFRKAGADKELIEALWEKEQWNPPQGEPLTEKELMAWIQAGTHPNRIAKLVTARKVDMMLTPETIKRLQQAGASDQLIVVVTTNVVFPKPSIKPLQPAYDEILAKARAALVSGKYEAAETDAIELKLKDAARPEAYSLLGYIHLYHYNGLSKAETEYRSALERGGEVEFQVKHFDGTSWTRKVETCSGSLFLKKGTLVFKSRRSDHSIALQDKEILGADKRGISWRNPMNSGGVELKVSTNDKPIIFYSARDKDEKEEEEILARLIDLIRH
jgi:hypothetical protein